MMVRSLNKLVLFIVIILFLVVYWTPIISYATNETEQHNKTIKVFLPLQEGIVEIDQNGKYSGYTYEYLMRVAQLTGWNYEFHTYQGTNENLSKGLEMVKNGELDLTGTMNYNERFAESYQYSISYGDTSYALVTKEDNELLNARTLAEFEGLKVAIISGAEGQNNIFDNFCKENNIKYQPVYAKDNRECRAMLDNGSVDAIISKDISRNAECKIIAEFTSTPFYFASHKGNTVLINELNQALRDIAFADPGYRLRLHEKYFPLGSGKYLALTSDEKDYIKNSPILRVAIMGGRSPIQDYNDKTREFSGIIIDIIKQISRYSQLKFEFIYVKDKEELERGLRNNNYDIVAGIPYDYKSVSLEGSNRLLLTPPIFSSPIIHISNIQRNSNNSNLIVSRSIKIFDDRKDIVYYDDINEIFRLVNSGEYGEAYVNGYMAQYISKYNNYSDVALTLTPYGNYELCLGITSSNELHLINILTQAIAYLPDNAIESIVYQNTNYEVDNSFLSIFRRNPAQLVVPTIIILVIVLVLISMLFVKTKRLNKMIAKEKNEYKAISQRDSLSKAYNNSEFKKLTVDYLTDETIEPSGALIVCDIDNFKHINDTYGHLMGDDVIISLGSVMWDIFRNDGIVGRLGGDEFMVLLKNTTDINAIEQSLIELKKRCGKIMAERLLTLSVGVSVFKKRTDFNELFTHADESLYQVKKSGKNNYKIEIIK